MYNNECQLNSDAPAFRDETVGTRNALKPLASKWFLANALQLPSHIWPDQNQLAEQEKHIISAQTGLATAIKRIKIAQIGTERILKTATSNVIVLLCPVFVLVLAIDWS